MANNYSSVIATAIKNYMENENLRHTFDSERGVFKAGFAVSDDCLIGNVQLVIRVNEDSFSSSALCPINAPSKYRDAVAEFTTRLNWTLRSGNFEMDYSDGEIRYKVHVNCAGQIPSEPIIKSAVHIPVSMFANYGEALSDVLTGQCTAKEAADRCDDDDSSSEPDLSEIEDLVEGLDPETRAMLIDALRNNN